MTSTEQHPAPSSPAPAQRPVRSALQSIPHGVLSSLGIVVLAVVVYLAWSGEATAAARPVVLLVSLAVGGGLFMAGQRSDSTR